MSDAAISDEMTRDRFLAEMRKVNAEGAKLLAEQEKLNAESRKLAAEARKLDRDRVTSMIIAAATVGGVVATLIGLGFRWVGMT